MTYCIFSCTGVYTNTQLRGLHSRVALSGKSVALQAWGQGDVTDDGATATTLQTHPGSLGPHSRGRDDDSRDLHQPGHLLRLPERKKWRVQSHGMLHRWKIEGIFHATFYMNQLKGERPSIASSETYLEVADGGRMGITLQHDLDFLHCLLSQGPGTGHLVSHLLGSLLQLSIIMSGLSLKGSFSDIIICQIEYKISMIRSATENIGIHLIHE